MTRLEDHLAAWRPELDAMLRNIDPMDADDRAILRMRVRDAVKLSTVDGINLTIKSLGGSPERTREAAIRRLGEILLAERTFR